MKKVLNRDYISYNDTRCPYCGSHDAEKYDHEELDGGTYRFDFLCTDCNRKWQEEFRKVCIYSDWWDYGNTDCVSVSDHEHFNAPRKTGD